MPCERRWTNIGGGGWTTATDEEWAEWSRQNSRAFQREIDERLKSDPAFAENMRDFGVKFWNAIERYRQEHNGESIDSPS